MNTASGRTFIREAMTEIAKEKLVLDVGGGDRFSKWLKEYQPLFANTEYKTLDYDDSTEADVIGDIHAIPLSGDSVDAIICASVLEHVRDPRKAIQELTRILRPGGKIFLHVPSIYPYHARKGHYPDYWRFFEDTVQEFFLGYAHIEIRKQGGIFLAFSFFCPMQHRLRWLLNPLASGLDVLFHTETRTTTAGYYVYAIK